MDEHLEHPHHVQLLSHMKRLYIIGFVLICASAYLAYKYFNPIPYVENIQSYDLKMDVRENKEIMVTETIVYDFGYNRKAGVSRYIPLTTAGDQRLDITVSNVVDESGAPYKYETLTIDDVLVIKIGDPDDRVKGIRTYKISYDLRGGIVNHGKFDEIYWNVTGDQWSKEIKSATTAIRLPAGTNITRMDCFTGPRGSTERNCTYSSSKADELSGAFFLTTKPLMVIEGFTILVDFQLGI